MINLNVTNYLQSFLVLIRMAITLDKVIRVINTRAVPNMIPWSELEMAMFHWSAITLFGGTGGLLLWFPATYLAEFAHTTIESKCLEIEDVGNSST